jgi:acetyltransferase-like isoleucine patch superfamily enzyme
MIKKIKKVIFLFLIKLVESFQAKKKLYKKKELISQFKNVGVSFRVSKDFTVINPKYIEIGNNFTCKERFRIEAIDNYNIQTFTPHIKIGNNVSFNTDIHIGCIDSIEIGDNCLFASRIYISDHDHGNATSEMINIAPAKRPLISKGKVVIKNNVWIGEGVSILSGVTIGENVIVGTNSVVTKNVPSNTVVVGVPAKIIKIIN